MLKIPLSDIISKIKQEKGISEEEINSKIDSKLHQLAGLVSKEGAAHIVANELGVKIFEQGPGKLQINNILTGMRNVDVAGKVVRKFDLREFVSQKGPGKVASFVFGDETGTIRVAMWGEQAESIKKFNEGDVVKLSGGYVRENQGRKEVHMNERGSVAINPPGETIGEVKEFQESERKNISDLEENMQNIEVLGTIVQAFEPRFFEVCPECGKRMKLQGEKFACDIHSTSNPAYSYVMNAFLDDGTDNIRCVFFKNQAERLLNMTHEKILEFKDNPADFENVKNDLLGNQIKIVGKVNKNQMFDRIELVAQLVYTELDPNEEAKKIPKPSEKSFETSSEEPVTEEEEITSEVEKVN